MKPFVFFDFQYSSLEKAYREKLIQDVDRLKSFLKSTPIREDPFYLDPSSFRQALSSDDVTDDEDTSLLSRPDVDIMERTKPLRYPVYSTYGGNLRRKRIDPFYP